MRAYLNCLPIVRDVDTLSVEIKESEGDENLDRWNERFINRVDGWMIHFCFTNPMFGQSKVFKWDLNSFKAGYRAAYSLGCDDVLLFLQVDVEQ